MSDWCLRAFLPIWIVSACGILGCEDAAGRWPYTVEMGRARILVEVALTPEQRERGLMFRDELDATWGMLFVYDAEDALAFWMKNTRIPLSIAFLDGGRVVREVLDMTPMSEELHTSKAPAMYALEANRGWFTRHGVTPGTQATFSPALDALIRDSRRGK